jgi:dTDP-4-amino-4,6-dideoxygalactose transaminase
LPVPEWKVPLSDLTITDGDLAVLTDVYRSGWLSMGPRTEELEHALAQYTGAQHAVAAANGTAALHLMCLAAGLAAGDEVIVPSLTFVATANSVAYTGARPVFADIASASEPWLSVSSVEAALTPASKAVLAVSYGGCAGQLEPLTALCAERGLTLLEDAAHSLGSRQHGRQLGRFGVAGAFSFFSNKNLAVGEGGALVTDDDELAQRARLLRSHGMTAISWDRIQGHASGYDVVELGFNYRIDEPRAALAAARLERLDAENARRGELDRRYRQALAELDLQCPLEPAPDTDPNHHLFCVLLNPDADREAFRAALAADGVQTSLHYPPIHHFSIYRQGGLRLPHTEDYASRAVTLPMYAELTHSQQDLVVDAVRAALGS